MPQAGTIGVSPPKAVKFNRLQTNQIRATQRAFTLVEVVMSTSIAALTVSGVIYGYIQSSKRAEWSAYSLAAQSQAMQVVERARAAKWDPSAVPATDKLVASEFPAEAGILDIPIATNQVVLCTNYTTITTIS